MLSLGSGESRDSKSVVFGVEIVNCDFVRGHCHRQVPRPGPNKLGYATCHSPAMPIAIAVRCVDCNNASALSSWLDHVVIVLVIIVDDACAEKAKEERKHKQEAEPQCD